MDYTEDLKRAQRLADIADEIGMDYYLAQDLKVETKPDKSPCTEADTKIEKELSRIVIEEFEDSYVGEEGTNNADKSRRWLVDPIDGTKNFMRGMPVWGSLISLKDGDEVVVACVSAPAMGKRWWAAKGEGAFTRDPNGEVRQIKVSDVGSISDSFLMFSELYKWDDCEVGCDKVVSLLKSAWRSRGMGDFLEHMMVAEGAGDAAFEYGPKLWDLEAPGFIVREAGGKTWDNADDSFKNDDSRIFVTANGKLLKPVLDKLGL